MVSPRRFQINPEEEALREKANETARIITGDPTAQGEVKDPARFLRHLETEQDINQVFKTFQGTVDQIRNDPALPQVVADEQRLRLERGLPPSVHLESSQNFLRGYDEWEKRLPESRPYVEPTGPGFTTPMVAPEKVAGFGRRTDPLGWAFKEKYGPTVQDPTLSDYIKSTMSYADPVARFANVLGPEGVAQQTSPLDVGLTGGLAGIGPVAKTGLTGLTQLARRAPLIGKGLQAIPRVVQAFVEPVTTGGLGSRLMGELALQQGAIGAMQLAEPGIQKLPGPLQTPARFVTGAAGGGGVSAGIQLGPRITRQGMRDATGKLITRIPGVQKVPLGTGFAETPRIPGPGEVPISESRGNTAQSRGLPNQDPKDFQYKIIESDEVIQSTDPITFTPKENYPKELQARKREDIKLAQEEIKSGAKKLDIEEVTSDIGTIDRGIPIVGKDNIVESGNGRIMRIKLAIFDHPNQYAKYRKALKEKAEALGIDPDDIDKFKNPILVRERITELDFAGRIQFAEEANQAQVAPMTTFEQSGIDANKITPAMINKLNVLNKAGNPRSIDATLRAADNREFVKSFFGALPENQLRLVIDGSGNITQEGMDRIRRAIFAAAFDNKRPENVRLFEKLEVQADDDGRNIRNAINTNLAQLAVLENQIAAGARNIDQSFSNDLSVSVQKYFDLKDQGISVDDYFLQTMMIEDLTPFQKKLLAYINQNSNSPKQLSEGIQNLTKGILETPPQTQAGFGGITPSSAEQIFDGLQPAMRTDIVDQPSLMEQVTRAPAKAIRTIYEQLAPTTEINVKAEITGDKIIDFDPYYKRAEENEIFDELKLREEVPFIEQRGSGNRKLGEDQSFGDGTWSIRKITTRKGTTYKPRRYDQAMPRFDYKREGYSYKDAFEDIAWDISFSYREGYRSLSDIMNMHPMLRRSVLEKIPNISDYKTNIRIFDEPDITSPVWTELDPEMKQGSLPDVFRKIKKDDIPVFGDTKASSLISLRDESRRIEEVRELLINNYQAGDVYKDVMNLSKTPAKPPDIPVTPRPAEAATEPQRVEAGAPEAVIPEQPRTVEEPVVQIMPRPDWSDTYVAQSIDIPKEAGKLIGDQRIDVNIPLNTEFPVAKGVHQKSLLQKINNAYQLVENRFVSGYEKKANKAKMWRLYAKGLDDLLKLEMINFPRAGIRRIPRTAAENRAAGQQWGKNLKNELIRLRDTANEMADFLDGRDPNLKHYRHYASVLDEPERLSGAKKKDVPEDPGDTDWSKSKDVRFQKGRVSESEKLDPNDPVVTDNQLVPRGHIKGGDEPPIEGTTMSPGDMLPNPEPFASRYEANWENPSGEFQRKIVDVASMIPGLKSIFKSYPGPPMPLLPLPGPTLINLRAAFDKNPVARIMISYQQLRADAHRLVTAAAQTIYKDGTRKQLIGDMDDAGRFTAEWLPEQLRNKTLNELAENYPLRMHMTENQIKFLDNAKEVSEASRKLLARNGIELDLIDPDTIPGGQYADRIIFGKTTPDGVIQDIGFLGKTESYEGGIQERLLRQTINPEFRRVFTTVEEALEAGYILVPYDEAVEINARAAYNLILDKKLADELFSLVDEAGRPLFFTRKEIRVIGDKDKKTWSDIIPKNQKLDPSMGGPIHPKLKALAEREIAKEPNQGKLEQEFKRFKAELTEDVVEKSQLHKSSKNPDTKWLYFRQKDKENGKIVADYLKVNQGLDVYDKKVVGKILRSVTAYNQTARQAGLGGDQSIFAIQWHALIFEKPSVAIKGVWDFNRFLMQGLVDIKTPLSQIGLAQSWKRIGNFESLKQTRARLIKDNISFMSRYPGVNYPGVTESTELFARGGVVTSMDNWFANMRRADAKWKRALANPSGITYKSFRNFFEWYQHAWDTTHSYAAIRLTKSLDEEFGVPGDASRKADIEDLVNQLLGQYDHTRMGLTPAQQLRESLTLRAARLRRSNSAFMFNAMTAKGPKGTVARRALFKTLAATHSLFFMTAIGLAMRRGATPEQAVAEGVTAISPVVQDSDGNSIYNSRWLAVNVAEQGEEPYYIGNPSKFLSDLRFFGKYISEIHKALDPDQESYWFKEARLTNNFILDKYRGEGADSIGFGFDVLRGHDYLGDPLWWINPPDRESGSWLSQLPSNYMVHAITQAAVPTYARTFLEGNTSTRPGLRENIVIGTGTEYAGLRQIAGSARNILEEGAKNTYGESFNNLEAYQKKDISRQQEPSLDALNAEQVDREGYDRVKFIVEWNAAEDEKLQNEKDLMASYLRKEITNRQYMDYHVAIRDAYIQKRDFAVRNYQDETGKDPWKEKDEPNNILDVYYQMRLEAEGSGVVDKLEYIPKIFYEKLDQWKRTLSSEEINYLNRNTNNERYAPGYIELTTIVNRRLGRALPFWIKEFHVSEAARKKNRKEFKPERKPLKIGPAEISFPGIGAKENVPPTATPVPIPNLQYSYPNPTPPNLSEFIDRQNTGQNSPLLPR